MNSVQTGAAFYMAAQRLNEAQAHEEDVATSYTSSPEELRLAQCVLDYARREFHKALAQHKATEAAERSTRHHHTYRSDVSAWWCRECDTVTDYCTDDTRGW